jgi:SPP1 family predicted phage head-tail adaptor
MRAGRLRHRVTFQVKGTEDTEYGEKAKWTDSVTLWAEVRQPGGSESGGSRDVAVSRIEVELRYRSDITSAMRAVFRGVAYDIEGPPSDPDGRGRTMVIRGAAVG